MGNKTKLFLFVIAVMVFFSKMNYAQSELVIEPFSVTGDFLESALNADTERPADRVYVLRRYGTYYLSVSFDLVDFDLRFKAEDSEGDRPVIYAFRNTNGSYNGQMFRIQSANTFEAKGIAFVGWAEGTEDFDRNVTQVINGNGAGHSIIVDDCIFHTTSATNIRMGASVNYFRATNSVFSHSANLLQTNIGNGRAIDFRDVEVDSAYIQNCSFVNFTDRAIRHYNAKAPIHKFTLDHCTFMNILAEHGCISLGSIEGEVGITNNLFVDNFIFGNDPTSTGQNGRGTEFTYTGEFFPNGEPRMTFVGSVPNDTTFIHWTVDNNYYSVSSSLQTFYDSHSELEDLAPLTWHINSKLGADSVNAFRKVADPIVFADAPATPIAYAEWFFKPESEGGAGKLKANATFSLELGFDRRDIAYFESTFNCSYQESSSAYTGAQGYPAGDLNWFPTLKTKWENGETVGADEIDVLPTELSLDQNYPNPFNPTTKIVYNVPEQSKIQLDVFNVLGQRVASLVNEVQTSGKYTVDFNASQLSSGVYFYRLSTQNLTLSKKMILMK